MAVYLSDFADALPAHVLAALGMQPQEIASTRSFKGGRATTSRGRPALNGPMLT